MSSPGYEQLDLGVPIRPQNEVGWIVGEQSTVKRKWWFGKNIVSRIITDKKGLGLWHTINADDISKLTDHNLAYALRFADAVRSIGWIQDEPGSSSSWKHAVLIEATDDGFDSRLINAIYTGYEGDFERTLQIFGPDHENN